jgi:hypothetical protein
MNPTQSNNANMRSSFLKEMGITEWVDRSSSVAPLNSPVVPQGNPQASTEPTVNGSERAVEISGRWIFIGTKPQGDALTLFQNIVRVLGLPQWRLGLARAKGEHRCADRIQHSTASCDCIWRSERATLDR